MIHPQRVNIYYSGVVCKNIHVTRTIESIVSLLSRDSSRFWRPLVCLSAVFGHVPTCRRKISKSLDDAPTFGGCHSNTDRRIGWLLYIYTLYIYIYILIIAKSQKPWHPTVLRIVLLSPRHPSRWLRVSWAPGKPPLSITFSRNKRNGKFVCWKMNLGKCRLMMD